MSLPCSVIPCHSLRISQRRRWTHFLRIALRMWGFYGSGFSFRKIPLQSDGEGDASCSLPAFWLVYSSFCYLPPPPLAQQVKKSNHRHSGCWVPTPELCLWWRCGVSSPSRASPACPASFSLCSKQREAPAAEGKEAETVPPAWCPSLPHCVALSTPQHSSHSCTTFPFDFTALHQITDEVSDEV